jgi:hypothetical protein
MQCHLLGYGKTGVSGDGVFVCCCDMARSGLWAQTGTCAVRSLVIHCAVAAAGEGVCRGAVK